MNKLSNLKILSQWTLVVLLLIFCVHYFFKHEDELFIILDINLIYIFAIIILHLFYFLIQTYRLNIIMEIISGVKVSYYCLYKAFMLGKFLNKFVPQAGTIYTGVQLKKTCNLKYTNFASGFIFFTWFDIWLNLLIAATIIYLTNLKINIFSVHASNFFIFISCLTFITPFFLYKILHIYSFNNFLLEKIHTKIKEIVNLILLVLKKPRFLIKISLLGLLLYIPMCARIYIVFLALGHPLGLASLIIFYVLLKMSQHINITPGNLGVQEIALGYAAEQVGIGVAEGILASVILRILAYICLIVNGLSLGGWDLLRNKRYAQDVEISS